MNRTDAKPSAFDLVFGVCDGTAADRVVARCLPIAGVHAREPGALLLAAVQADLVRGNESLALGELVNRKEESARE